MTDFESFAQLIKYYREYELRLTQEDFAESIGVTRECIQKWEYGKTIPRTNRLDNIFGTDRNYLQEGVELLIMERENRKNQLSPKSQDLNSEENIVVSLPEKKSKEIRNETDIYKMLSKDIKIDINNSKIGTNTFLFGTTGSGKNRFYIEPNISLANTNYIILDPGGYNYEKHSQSLKDKGFDVKLLDFSENYTSNEDSFIYNPFVYFANEENIRNYINVFQNMTYVGDDEFWKSTTSEILYYLFLYVWKEYVYDKFHGYGYVAPNANILEVDSLLDKIIEEEAQNEEHGPLWKSIMSKTLKYDSLSKETRKHVLINIKILLTYSVVAYKKMGYTKEDCIGSSYLYDFGDHPKQALFIKMSRNDEANCQLQTIALNQFISMVMSGVIYPLPLRIIIDEIENAGIIPELDKFLAIMRKTNVTVDITSSTIAAFKNVYPNTYNNILANCNIVLYSCNDYQTSEYLSKKMGKSSVLTNKLVPFKLISFKKYGQKVEEEQLYNLSDDQCIVFLQGREPIITTK